MRENEIWRALVHCQDLMAQLLELNGMGHPARPDEIERRLLENLQQAGDLLASSTVLWTTREQSPTAAETGPKPVEPIHTTAKHEKHK